MPKSLRERWKEIKDHEKREAEEEQRRRAERRKKAGVR